MDLLNRALAWAVYIAGAVIVGAVSFLALDYYRPGASARVVIQDEPPMGYEGLSAAEPGEEQVVPGTHADQVYSQRAEIKRLQTLLTQKTELLDKKTRLLAQKTAEQESLRAELDEAISLLEILAAELASGEPSSASDNAELRQELERLKAESEKNRASTAALEAELEQLRAELVATDTKIAESEAASELEVNALVAERQALESAVSAVLLRLGNAVVPRLVEQLAHPQAHVRRWAATVLGEMGPAAKEAGPSLIELQGDADPGVREAVRHALELIDTPAPVGARP
jgi:hypothetical protein